MILKQSLENELIKEKFIKNYFYIAGFDEAGRGCWAGPVVAACVVFPKSYVNDDIQDSKQMTQKKRESLISIIHKDCITYGIGFISPNKIDEINIVNASKSAMILAYKEASKKINIDALLIDALVLKQINKPQLGLIKGENRFISIAAASILAKVSRDHYMSELAKKYPQYSFDRHYGYGTKQHQIALKKYGAILSVHRYSYKPIKKIQSKDEI